MKVKLGLALRFFISILLLGLLLWFMRGKYNMILAELRCTNLLLFFSAFLLFCANIIFVTLRLETILIGENIRMPFVRLMELNYIGYFFNNFMPSAVGGDIIKAYYTGLITNQKAKSYISIFMDRLTGLFSFAFIAFIAILFSWNRVANPAIKKSVLTFVTLCVFVAIISLNVKIAKVISKILSKISFMNIGDKLMKIYSILHNYRNKKALLFKTFIISLIAQVSYFTVVYILFKSVNLGISFKSILLVMPIVSVICMLPSIGGLGLREGAIVALFSPMVGSGKAFGVSVLLLAILFLISTVGGIIYLSSPQFRGVKIKETKGDML